MTDIKDQIAALVRECYEQSREGAIPTRPVAVELVARLTDGPLLRRLAAEFLVDALARAMRAKTLEAERAAQTERESAIQAANSTPEALARAARRQQEADEAEMRHLQMFYGVIGKALERYAEDLRIKWTADLLDSTFALADGTAVTWGDATVEQHAERRQMFLNNAHANMEGAARHEVAIRELREAGKATLREMTEVAVLTMYQGATSSLL